MRKNFRLIDSVNRERGSINNCLCLYSFRDFITIIRPHKSITKKKEKKNSSKFHKGEKINYDK